MRFFIINWIFESINWKIKVLLYIMLLNSIQKRFTQTKKLNLFGIKSFTRASSNTEDILSLVLCILKFLQKASWHIWIQKNCLQFSNIIWLPIILNLKDTFNWKKVILITDNSLWSKNQRKYDWMLGILSLWKYKGPASGSLKVCE